MKDFRYSVTTFAVSEQPYITYMPVVLATTTILLPNTSLLPKAPTELFLSCSTQPSWQNTLAVQDSVGLRSSREHPTSSPLEPDSVTVLGHSIRDDILVLPSEITFLYSFGFVQNGHAHACKDGSGIAARTRKGEVLLNSPSRGEELVSPTPCLHMPCRDPVLPSLSDFSCSSPAFQHTRKLLFRLPTFLTSQGNLQSHKTFRPCLAEF